VVETIIKHLMEGAQAIQSLGTSVLVTEKVS
jgi:hypothetical protein